MEPPINAFPSKGSTVVKAELGTKRTCPSCAARFYDLMKNPIVCPKCNANFVAASVLPSKGEMPAMAPAPKPRVVEVGPNKPLVVDGTKVFLVGHGYAPKFTIVDGEGAGTIDDPLHAAGIVSADASVARLDGREAGIGQQAGIAPMVRPLVLPATRLPGDMGPVDRRRRRVSRGLGAARVFLVPLGLPLQQQERRQSADDAERDRAVVPLVRVRDTGLVRQRGRGGQRKGKRGGEQGGHYRSYHACGPSSGLSVVELGCAMRNA